MSKPFRIVVFGKPDCDKCKVLNQRIESLLSQDKWSDFEKVYYDLETEEGLVQFAESECINSQKIPALLVLKQTDDSGDYIPLNNPNPGAIEEVFGKSKLYNYLGLHTDYSDTGRGVISPQMIAAVLDEARAI